MDFTIIYYSEAVQDEILALPDTLAARYVVLTTPQRELEVAQSRLKEVRHANP